GAGKYDAGGELDNGSVRRRGTAQRLQQLMSPASKWSSFACSYAGECRCSGESLSLERPPLHQGIERLREFVDPRLIGMRQAGYVAAAGLAGGEPPLLSVDDVAAL